MALSPDAGFPVFADVSYATRTSMASPSFTTGAGSHFVVAIVTWGRNTTGTLTAKTGTSASLTWSQLFTADTSAGPSVDVGIEVWGAVAPAGVTSETFSLGFASADTTGTVAIYSFTNASGLLGTTISQVNGSNNNPQQTLTPTAVGSFLIAMAVGRAGGGSQTANANSTADHFFQDGSLTQDNAFDHLTALTASTSPVTYGATAVNINTGLGTACAGIEILAAVSTAAPDIGFRTGLAPRMDGPKNPVSRFRSPSAFLTPDPPAAPVVWQQRGPFRRNGPNPINRFRTPLAYFVPTAGTQFLQSVDGTLTPAGSLVNQTGKILAGSLTSSGLLVKQTQKMLAGTLTDSGLLAKQAGKVFAGTLTSSGAIVKQTGKVLAGSMTSAGALVKQTQKVIAGALSSSGALVKRTATSMAGSLTSSGLLVKQTGKILAGTLTSSGALTFLKVALLSLAGTLTSSGLLVKQTGKSLSGAFSSAGGLVKRTATSMAGSLTSAGSLVASKVGAAVARIYAILMMDD